MAKKSVRLSMKERIASTSITQQIKCAIVSILCVLFSIWICNYWLLVGLLVIFDIYIFKIIPWNGWKQWENKFLCTIADWVDAIVFALIAVYIINIFIFQNYKIPTSSLEKTLLIGDYLFVSKVSYGPRVPNTPLSFPLTHNTFPLINTQSYSNWIHWDYKRLKGFGKVKRNDIVVFNFPAGDTVAMNCQNEDYYDIVSRNGWQIVNNNPQIFGSILARPVDRRENYVKRCIGLPGDSLQIINNQVYINHTILPVPKKIQFNYFIETNGNLLTEKQFRKLNVNKDDQMLVYNPAFDSPEHYADLFAHFGIERNENNTFNPVYNLPLTQEAFLFLQKSKWVKTVLIEPENVRPEEYTYPYNYCTGWTRDNFGPVWVPKKGETIILNKMNLAMYRRCIVNYEGNVLRQKGNYIFINDTLTNSYTFKYDYYFMMGDNRHNSLDSRYWGFVPEDHIVGKPLFVWMSLDKDRGWFDGRIRWKRLFRFIENQ